MATETVLFGLKASDWASLAQTALLVIGGIWAFYQYRRTRKGEACRAARHVRN